MRRFGLIAAIVLALLLTACGGDTISTGERVLPTPRPAPTVAGESVTIETADTTDDVAVVGLGVDQVLLVHAQPGIDAPVIGEVPAGDDDVTFLGEAFETDDGIVWWLVRFETLQGWVRPDVAFIGPSLDITESIEAALGAETNFDTNEALALAVANQLASVNDPTSLVVVVSTTEVAGQFSATTTVDIIGVADDSLAGYRLLVTGNGTASSGERYRLESVQQRPLCARGLGTDGRCN